MENRITIINCTKDRFDRFIVRAQGQAVTTNHKPAGSSSPQERYTLICDGERVSVVWETKSQKLILTADNGVAERFEAIYSEANGLKRLPSELAHTSGQAAKNKPATEKSADKSVKKAAKTNAVSAVEKISAKACKEDKPEQAQETLKNSKAAGKKALGKGDSLSGRKESTKAASGAKADQTKRAKKIYTPLDYPYPHKIQSSGLIEAPKISAEKLKKSVAQPSVDDIIMEEAVALGLYDDMPKQEKRSKSSSVKKAARGERITKISPERFGSFVRRLKNDGSYSVTTVSDGESTEEIRIFKGKTQARLRYIKAKNQLYLEGQTMELTAELKSLLSPPQDYKTAVSSHIKLVGEEKKAGKIQRELKQKLPTAFEYLSEQSKIDLAIGLIDIMNDDVRLSDYSMLLVPPYRGLERFIYDLQISKGIEVKMIGQAFEKDDEGRYKLKVGYQRRIKSVIYNEALSSLYTEYFNKRNFYAHSDNTISSSNRIISDKSQVKQIFLQLLETIEYNSKKLKETGFSVTHRS